MPGSSAAVPLVRSVHAADRDLLAAKLVRPRVPEAYVPRPQVDRLLTRGTAGPLTTVVAGAGWGKTLAAAAWAASDPAVGPVAWVSLDRRDDEPRSIWSYVAAAVRRTVPLAPGNPLAQLSPGLGGGRENVRRVAAGFAELGSPLVLVLDDFHHVQDPDVLSGFSELLRLRIDAVRMVLLAREEPAISLHRLRMSDDLVEVRSQDLSFSVPEARTMLTAHAATVDDDDTALLVRRTEGWPAGLRLAASFLERQGTAARASDFGGGDRAVTEYLVEEVLAGQRYDVQRFLLRTSVPERLTGGLAEALTDQPLGQRSLESLESSNTFVVGLGPGREWFRYHSLLREMLLHRLKAEDPELLAELHRRASQWYAEAGYPLESLRHAAEAADWPRMGRIFVLHALPLVVSADRASLDEVLARIPSHRLTAGPDLALCGAARMLYAGRFTEMQPHLERAASQLDHGEEPPGTRVALRLLSMAVSRARGDIAALEEASEAALVELTGQGAALPAADAFRTVALGNVGTALFWSGRVREAAEQLTRGLEVSADVGLEAARINMMSHLALAAVVTGDLDRGRRHATQALDIVEARGWAPLAQAATAYLALALIDTETLHLDEAQYWLQQGLASAVEPAPRLALGLALARMTAARGQVGPARAHLDRLARDVDAWRPPTYLARWSRIIEAELDLASGDAAAAASRIEPRIDTEPPFVWEQVCRARAALLSGEPERADEILEPLRDEPAGTATVEVWLATALVADRRHEDDRAVRALRTALDLAEPGGVRRPFVTLASPGLPRLLSRARHLGSGAAGFVDRILRDLGAEDPHAAGHRAAQPMTEPLTERELSVLRHLPTMMTNAEIAAELYVSTNTVKAHLKSVFRKLGVTTRRDAVHRARELGLLTG